MSEAQTPQAAAVSIDDFSVQNAPVLYFDTVPVCGNNQGVMSLMLGIKVIAPSRSGQTISKQRIVAHLRCTATAARHLRDAIDRALLLGAEPQGGKN
jgi:hypothetical protein